MPWELLKSILEREDWSTHHKIIFIVFCFHANPDGMAWPSLTRLKLLTGLSRTKIYEIVGELIDEGVLLKTGKRWRKSTIYEVRHTDSTKLWSPPHGQKEPMESATRTVESATRTKNSSMNSSLENTQEDGVRHTDSIGVGPKKTPKKKSWVQEMMSGDD